MMFRDRGIEIKTREQILSMRAAGLVVGRTLELLRGEVRAGITTGELDAIAEDNIRSSGATPSFKGYHGFTGSICASVNDEIVHGIPGGRVLADGDLISIDCGAIVDGYHGDAAFTAGVGTIDAEAERLVDVTRRALEVGIAELRPGGRLGDLGAAVESTIERAGFSVVRDYVGHGIGTAMHEPPDVPNFGKPGRGKKVTVGDVFAVEPMVCAGSDATEVLDDGWTVVTVDGSLAAHWEHTVAVTDDGPEILTLP
jgi:methionyl aminopeptidase